MNILETGCLEAKEIMIALSNENKLPGYEFFVFLCDDTATAKSLQSCPVMIVSKYLGYFKNKAFS